MKQRTIYVYVPNEQMCTEWKQAAKKAGVSISAFVQEAMELYLARYDLALSKQTLEEKFQQSLKSIDQLREENIQLHHKLERMDTLLDRYEKQLKDTENDPFLSGEQYGGIRKYNRRLIELFRKENTLNEEEIPDTLHIPPTDAKSIKAINRQIENLLNYGIITPHRDGYQWCG